MSSEKKPEETTSEYVENENKEDEDNKILNQMEELTHAMARKKKRAKKLLAKRLVYLFIHHPLLFFCAWIIPPFFSLTSETRPLLVSMNEMVLE